MSGKDDFGSNVGGTPDYKNFYDKFVYEPLHFKKRRGGAHSVGLEVEAVMPDTEEVRLLGNRHR
jgi:hypothetical protein